MNLFFLSELNSLFFSSFLNQSYYFYYLYNKINKISVKIIFTIKQAFLFRKCSILFNLFLSLLPFGNIFLDLILLSYHSLNFGFICYTSDKVLVINFLYFLSLRFFLCLNFLDFCYPFLIFLEP